MENENHYALVGNAADEAQVKEGKRREKSERDRELDALRWVLSDRRGRAFLWSLIGRCGLYEGGQSTSDQAAHYRDGEQTIGIYVIRECIEASADHYMTMQLEGMKKA